MVEVPIAALLSAMMLAIVGLAVYRGPFGDERPTRRPTTPLAA